MCVCICYGINNCRFKNVFFFLDDVCVFLYGLLITVKYLHTAYMNQNEPKCFKHKIQSFAPLFL